MPTIERGTPSAYLQAKQLVWKAVLALKLDGLNEKEVVIRDLPWSKVAVFRGITIWGNKVVDCPNSSNYRNSVGYAVVISMVTKDEGSNSGGPEGSDRFPLWKSVLKRRFHHQQVKGLNFPGATHLSCTVQDSRLTIPRSHPDGAGKWQSDQVVVWFWVREAKDDGQ